MARQFEKRYRLSESDDVLEKMGAILRDLDQRLDAVEIVKESFEQGNRLDVDALLKAITNDISLKSAQMQALLEEIAEGFTPERIAESANKRFTSDAEQTAHAEGIAAANGRIDARATSAALGAHSSRNDNPHGVTAAQVGTLTTAQIDLAIDFLQASMEGGASVAMDTFGKVEAALGKRLRADAEQVFTEAERGRLRANARVDVVAGFRNKVINGDFEVWQRGTPVAAGAIGARYTADRWVVPQTPVGTAVTVTRMSHTAGQTAVPGNPAYFLRYARTSSGASSGLAQKIEGVRTFAGKRLTVTLHAKSDINMNADVRFNQVFGTGGSASVAAGVQTIALTTNFQKISLVFDIPAIAGKVIGDGDYLEILLFFPLAAGNRTIDISRVSVVEGDAREEHDPFAPRHIQQELALCQRYYERCDQSAIGFLYRANVTSGIVYQTLVNSLAEKRALPTIALSLVGVINFDSASILTNSITTRSFRVTCSANATGTGQFNGGWAADAEL